MKVLLTLFVFASFIYALMTWLKARARSNTSNKAHGKAAADINQREAELIAEARAQFGKKSEIESIVTKALDTGERWPVKMKSKLLSKSEKEMFDRLQDALYEHIVLPQVALSQIIECEDGNFGATWNKINRKVCDYVVCNQDFRVIAVVELDGWNHNQSSQQKKDADKDAAVTSAGLKMVRFDARVIPKGPEIRERLGVMYS